jgi:citrate synthase
VAANGGFRGGLEGVVVAETALSEVDGANGRLVYRGHDLETLARTARFEDVYGLLLAGGLPGAAERRAIAERLGRARAEAFARLAGAGAALASRSGMDALRAGLSHLEDEGPAEATHARLVGAAAVMAAAWARTRAGAAPVAPDPALPHAADFLRMATGAAPDAARAAALDAYLVTVVEHGMCASTFTARVVASTRSDLVSAVVAAVGALKGPLHGGAPGPVLDMLDAIGEPERAEAWLAGELAAGRRIMGLGHRVYRVRDPRAAVLEAAVERLEAAGVASRYLRLARAVERAAVDVLARRHPERRLETNVEFYTAVILDAVGFGRELFTPAFAASRTVGWLAHAEEQLAEGRIIRPDQRYVGPRPPAALAVPRPEATPPLPHA